MHKKLLLLFTLALFSHAANASGIAEYYGLSPFWDWKQIETEHFRVTFPAQLAETANKAANHLEEANTTLSKELYWQPKNKTQILVIDNEDSENGSTTPIGRFGIVLYVTPPDNFFSTAYYDDWLRLLAFHEYTHLVNMDTTHGFWQLGRTLFGDTLLPNAAWPIWMLEGLAVYNETRFTHSGRGRSPYYEMILRAGVESGTLGTGKFITLDRVNGPNPYFPVGETPYLFGYELMNQVALKSGEDALGTMSSRSAGRIPYFLNGNLENITGRSWYSYWDDFLLETRNRVSSDLVKIKSQPLTLMNHLTHEVIEIYGSATSPDGKWIAYTKKTLNEVQSLYLQNRRTGEIKNLGEKTLGVEMTFTPDSRHLIFTSLRRESEYYLFSKLGVYDLKTDSTHWIDHPVRVRDPSLSRDGKYLVVTSTEPTRTGLAILPVIYENDEITFGPLQTVFTAAPYARASTPQFSNDGKTVYFSLHENGKVSEEIVALDRATGKTHTLVDNGHFNRYPAINSKGKVYYVSDLTGVDNLFRYREGKAPEMVTNVTTGITFPKFGPKDELYASVLSYTGWDLAHVELLETPIPAQAVTVALGRSPVIDENSAPKDALKKYPVEDYSIFPSIWPRSWVPFGYYSPGNFSFGEAIIGFDAVDRHRYLLTLGYDSLSQNVDWLAEYQNRSYGVTLTLAAENQISTSSYSGNTVYAYSRDMIASFGASYPIFWTYSSLTPAFSFNLDKTSYSYPGANTATSNFDFQTGYQPNTDLVLTYSDAQNSPLAISNEEGRTAQIGSRVYINNTGTQTLKTILSDTEYLEFGNSHIVLIPSLKASYTSADASSNANTNADVILQGYFPNVGSGFPNTSLTALPIRGYPGETFYVKGAAISALDLRFPIAEIFRGWGTNPFFLRQIYGYGFAEATYLPFTNFSNPSGLPAFLTSTGVGLVANLVAFIQIPVSASVQYHYGFRPEAGGAGEVFTQLLYTGITF